MAYTKGKAKPPNSGRKKGVTNKVTSDVRAMVLAALDKAGGWKYLLKQSKENPTAFMTLVGKVLPTQLQHSNDPQNPLPPTAEVTNQIFNVTNPDDAAACFDLMVRASQQTGKP